MSSELYQNKRSKRKLIVVKKIGNMIQVQYTYSGLKYWYNEQDFDRLFELNK